VDGSKIVKQLAKDWEKGSKENGLGAQGEIDLNKEKKKGYHHGTTSIGGGFHHGGTPGMQALGDGTPSEFGMSALSILKEGVRLGKENC